MDRSLLSIPPSSKDIYVLVVIRDSCLSIGAVDIERIKPKCLLRL